jgi:hypothetical protein
MYLGGLTSRSYPRSQSQERSGCLGRRWHISPRLRLRCARDGSSPFQRHPGAGARGQQENRAPEIGAADFGCYPAGCRSFWEPVSGGTEAQRRRFEYERTPRLDFRRAVDRGQVRRHLSRCSFASESVRQAALGFPAGHVLRAPRLVESDLGSGLPTLAALFDLPVLGELGQNPVEVVGSNTHLLGHLGDSDARLGLN